MSKKKYTVLGTAGAGVKAYTGIMGGLVMLILEILATIFGGVVSMGCAVAAFIFVALILLMLM